MYDIFDDIFDDGYGYDNDYGMSDTDVDVELAFEAAMASSTDYDYDYVTNNGLGNDDFIYCSHCGARMDEERKDEE